MKKKVLVTGATGFVGSMLTRRLLFEGYEVSIFIRKSSDLWRINDLVHLCDVHHVDLCDLKSVERALKEIRPQVIYHLAANKAVSSIDSADDDIYTNVVGTRNLLKALSNFDYELFVNAGSSSEYGTKDRAMHEDDTLEPNSYHSFAKGAQTMLCETAALVEERPIITLRFFSVYGPYERPERLISSVVRNCLENKQLNLSSPYVGRDFIYIDDVVSACLQIPDLLCCTGEIFNIGTGVQSTIQDVVDVAFEVIGHDVPINWHYNSRSWDTNTWVADISKAREMLRWKPKYNLQEGLVKTFSWMKENG